MKQELVGIQAVHAPCVAPTMFMLNSNIQNPVSIVISYFLICCIFSQQIVKNWSKRRRSLLFRYIIVTIIFLK